MKQQSCFSSLVAVALVTVFSPPGQAQPGGWPEKAHAASWCEPFERVMFTCRSEQKTISLCLAGTAAMPRLRFVMGEKGQSPQVQVPSKGRQPWYGAFTYEEQHAANGGWLRLAAHPGELTYVLFQNWHRQGMPVQSAGVGVMRYKVQLELHVCNADSFTDPDLYHLDKWPGIVVPMDPNLVGAFLKLPALSWARCNELNLGDRVAYCSTASSTGPGE